MKHLNNNKLLKNLVSKGITCSRADKKLFEKYDYYQVVNAYKSLFVQDVEDIKKIFLNIDSDYLTGSSLFLNRYKMNFQVKRASNASDFKTEVCKFICEKYGLKFDKTDSYTDLQPKIDSISFIHHIYKSNTKYSDFIRMYEFEHSLRSVLLKYTLIIEENIKRIFISTLNNLNEEGINVEANFLANIDNYNTSASNTFAIQSLRKVIDLYGDEHSKPILRKRNQNLAIPYWIIINEMTLGQTLKTITNINEKVKNMVFQTCVNEFTNASVDIYDSSKPSSVIDREKSLIEDFSRMLQFIGELRNLLAHNQPVYGYNVENFDLCSFPEIKYIQPVVPKKVYTQQKQENRKNQTNPRDLISAYKRRKIANYMRSLSAFYGTDGFNSRITGTNIDLSWITYLIKKIVNHLGYNDFGNEVRTIFKKYNLIISLNEQRVDINEINSLIQLINNISVNDLNYSDIELMIESGVYKRKLKKQINKIRADINIAKKQTNRIMLQPQRSTYPPFVNQREYQKYTGIDFSFLNNL